MNTNTLAVKKQTASLVWLVDYSGEVVSEMPAGNRDSDGRWLKKHVSLNVAPRMHTSADVAMAEAFGVDCDELFAGRSDKR